MQINIEIDDKYIERNLYIFAGIESVARNQNNKGWEIKTVGCSRCGKCCMGKPVDWIHGEKDGNCQHLNFRANEYLCKLGSNRPFNCCVSDGWDDECDIRWQKI